MGSRIHRAQREDIKSRFSVFAREPSFSGLPRAEQLLEGSLFPSTLELENLSDQEFIELSNKTLEEDQEDPFASHGVVGAEEVDRWIMRIGEQMDKLDRLRSREMALRHSESTGSFAASSSAAHGASGSGPRSRAAAEPSRRKIERWSSKVKDQFTEEDVWDLRSASVVITELCGI